MKEMKIVIYELKSYFYCVKNKIVLMKNDE